MKPRSLTDRSLTDRSLTDRSLMKPLPPQETVRGEFLSDSATTTVCPWKGTAHYYTVTVDGQSNPDAAWYYPDPSARAQQIGNHIAFWKGVRIERDA